MGLFGTSSAEKASRVDFRAQQQQEGERQGQTGAAGGRAERAKRAAEIIGEIKSLREIAHREEREAIAARQLATQKAQEQRAALVTAERAEATAQVEERESRDAKLKLETKIGELAGVDASAAERERNKR